MNRSGLSLSLTASLAVAVALSVTSAQADPTKAQCLDANGNGQDLRRDGKLSAAREAFRQCAAGSCPQLLRDDCTRRLDDVEKAQPTIIFEAKDGTGNDLSAVKVTVDGLPLAERLAGAPLPIEPGEHTFTFETAGQPTLQKTFVIRESEKDRRESIVLGAATPAPSTTTLPPPPLPPGPSRPDTHPRTTMRIVGFVTGGVGARVARAGDLLRRHGTLLA